MNKTTLNTLVASRHFPDEKTLDEIIDLVESHPYCSTLQVLKAIGSRQFGRMDSREVLNLASVYISDRAKLYSYTVRPKLLEHIDSAAKSVEEVADEQKGSFYNDPKLASAVEVDKHGNDKVAEINEVIQSGALAKPDEDNNIQSAPLEARILIEAMGHLGEMEVSSSLSALASENLDLEHESKIRAKKITPIDTSHYSSFTQWLLTRGSAANKEAQPNAAHEQLIIDKFIQESPKISPAKAAFFSPSQMGKLSLVEDESFVSETLAKIYERQGDFKKAARAYKQLGLKYPEKRSYFAALEKGAESQLKN